MMGCGKAVAALKAVRRTALISKKLAFCADNSRNISRGSLQIVLVTTSDLKKKLHYNLVQQQGTCANRQVPRCSVHDATQNIVVAWLS